MGNIENCIFKKGKNDCSALNFTNKKAQCEKCKFYLTKEEQEEKRQKVIEWYRKRQTNYEDVVTNLFKGEKRYE